MKTIIFATGNQRKIKEANRTLEPFGIVVDSRAIEIDEIQHRDPAEITKAKVRAAYKVTHEPVVVSDTSWSIPALDGFPGGYMKDVAVWFDEKDWLAVMTRHADKRVFCHENIAYFDGQELAHFSTTYEGYFVDQPRGKIVENESFQRVIVLYGDDDKTMGEMYNKGTSSEGAELGHWKQFGEWFTKKARTINS